MLLEWIRRPHVAQWWRAPATLEALAAEYFPGGHVDDNTRAYIALLDDAPVGFIQSYVVMGSGDGWWETEADPGSRGIDQFLANEKELGRGLGSIMVAAFVERLFADLAVTKVQTDPSPGNVRAIRCYRRAGFVAQDEVATPDGPAVFMLRRRNDSTNDH